MSLTLSLTNALSGLRAAEASLSVISSNISNANTVGYTRKEQPLNSRIGGGGVGAGVSTGVVERKVDEFLRRDVRRQVSIEGSATVRDEFFSRMQEMLGSVSSGGVINAGITDLQSSLSALAASPSNSSLQKNVVEDARQIATDLNRMADYVQDLRTDAEDQLGQSVSTINTSLAKIEDLNRQITRAYAMKQPTGDLEDQRDVAVKDLAAEMGIQTFVRDSGEMVIYTSRGRTLLDGVANYINYTPQSSVSSVSTFTAIRLGANGTDITNEITTGRLAAIKDARDNTLPALDKQLNVFARALYEMSWAPAATPSTAASPNLIKAYGTFDSSAALPGATNVTYNGDFSFYDSDGVAYTAVVQYQRQAGGPPYTWDANVVSLTRKSDGSAPTITPALPQTVGSLMPSLGGTSTTTSLTIAHGSAPPTQIHFAFSMDTTQVTEAAQTSTLYPQNDNFRLFSNVDLNDATASNALNIKVNSYFDSEQTYTDGKPGNPGRLFVSGDNTPSVSQRMLTKFTQSFTTTYSSASAYDPVTNTPIYSAIGSNLPSGNYTLSSLSNAIVSQNSILASDASTNAKFQTEYVAQLETRAAEIDGVSVDEELANMTVYQKAYAASARVLDTTSTLFDILMGIGA